MSQQRNSVNAVMADNLQSDSDMEDWESADVDLVASNFAQRLHKDAAAIAKPIHKYDVEDNCEWNAEAEYAKVDKVDIPQKAAKSVSEDENSVILILVDLTALSGGKIHNRFDKYSVNDQDAKKKMCLEISSNYDKYSNDSELIMNQTVRHCSEIVWKDALESLRTQHKGHYWFPFFPPKAAN